MAKTKAEYEAEGYAAMSARVAKGGDWSISSACPYTHDGWQREAWLNGAWRLRNERRGERVKPGGGKTPAQLDAEVKAVLRLGR